MTSAFSYLLKSGGLEREKDYPYTGKDGTCKFDKSKIVASVKNYTVVSVDEEQIAANLLKHGPLASKYNRLHTEFPSQISVFNTRNKLCEQ
jgi:cathepsin F